MNDNARRKIALYLATFMSTIMVLSGCGAKETATTEKVTSEMYASGIIDDVTPIVYGEIEKQIINKVQEENVSDIVSPEAYDIIKDKVVENVIINYTSDPEAYLTDNQTEQVRELIKTVVDSIDAENLTATIVTDISEQTKEEMSKQIADTVNDALSDTTLSASTDKNGKVTVSSDIDSKLAEINKKIANITKEVELNKSVTLTDKDKKTIENAVTAQMASSDYVDKKTLQDEISKSLKSVTQAAVQGEKGDRGADGKTPTKGVDYFTNEDIAEIVSKVSATFTGTLTNEERTMIVNMLADRISDNTSSDDVSGGNAAYNNIQIEQIKNDIINSVGELRGEKGDRGTDGYTPVRGQDYFTDADVESMKEDVIAKITHIPEKGVDYFTDDELNVIKRDVIADLETKLEKGDKGDKGDTPVKGVDYFTDEEVESITTGITNTVKESINTLQEKVQENADKITLLNEQKDVLAADITTLKSQTADIIVSDGETEQKISDILADINTKQQKIEEIESKIADIKQSYLDLNTYNSFVSSTNTTLGALAAADTSLQNSIASLREDVNNAYTELEELINTKQDSSNFDDLNAAYNEFKQATESTLSSLNATSAALQTSKLNSTEYQNYVAEMKTTITGIKKSISDIETKIADDEADITDIQTVVSKNTTDIQTANTSITSINGKIDTINGKLEDAIYIISFDTATGTLKTRSANYTE